MRWMHSESALPFCSWHVTPFSSGWVPFLLRQAPLSGQGALQTQLLQAALENLVRALSAGKGGWDVQIYPQDILQHWAGRMVLNFIERSMAAAWRHRGICSCLTDQPPGRDGPHPLTDAMWDLAKNTEKHRKLWYVSAGLLRENHCYISADFLPSFFQCIYDLQSQCHAVYTSLYLDNFYSVMHCEI